MIPQLALHILEGLTPPEHEVRIIEEEVEDVDLDEECDVVGISCMTANAPRAYYLSGEFRKRGRKVILGGVHPTLLSKEALQHGDAVVVGEGETVWEQIIKDIQEGCLQRTYHEASISLDRYIPMRYRKAAKRRPFDIIPLMTTRGCPYSCEFCCVSDLFGKKIRHAPVHNIVRDLVENRNRLYIFLDDNIIGDPLYAKALFKAIKPFKIKWVGQSSISFIHDAELMRLAVESGCIGLFFGIESVSETQLKRMPKSIKQVQKIEEAIRKVKDLGIHFHASVVFGFDSDTQAIFPETLEFLNRNKIGTASLNILTPYPGTRVYQQFKEEGRLLSKDWRYYDHATVVFRPRNMTPYELQAGTAWVKKEYVKMSSIATRLLGNMSHPLLYLAMNLGMRKTTADDARRLSLVSSQIRASNGETVGGEDGVEKEVVAVE
jgi:radical SAM superfamily enzyme YgiQ (UPF0313 family)